MIPTSLHIQLSAPRLRRAWVRPLQRTWATYRITTPLRQAHFLGQVGHESAGFRRTVESFRYSRRRAAQVFGHRFTYDEINEALNDGAEALANLVYGGAFGRERLGNTEPNDGWRYRGRGLIMLTGRENYNQYQASLDRRGIRVNVVEEPDLVGRAPLALDVTGWYWEENNLNMLAQRDDLVAVTRRINGGVNGLADRERLTKHAKRVLRVASRRVPYADLTPIETRDILHDVARGRSHA